MNCGAATPAGPGRTRSRIRIGALGAVMVMAVGIAASVLGREYLLPKRLATVEPGLYRSGYNQPGPLRRIIRTYGIRQVLCLANYTPDTPKGRKEHDVAREMGVEVTVLPMPGDGRADFARLDQAADFVADPANRPLLVHCAAGVQRTGATIAAYRMKHQGWTYEQAVAEAERHGLDPGENPELYAYLRRYERYLKREAAATTRPAPATQPAG